MELLGPKGVSCKCVYSGIAPWWVAQAVGPGRRDHGETRLDCASCCDRKVDGSVARAVRGTCPQAGADEWGDSGRAVVRNSASSAQQIAASGRSAHWASTCSAVQL